MTYDGSRASGARPVFSLFFNMQNKSPAFRRGLCGTHVVYDKVSLTSRSHNKYSIFVKIMQVQQKNPLFREDFSCLWSCIYKPNSVFRPKPEDSNLSRPKLALWLKRFSPICIKARSCTRVKILPFHSH